MRPTLMFALLLLGCPAPEADKGPPPPPGTLESRGEVVMTVNGMEIGKNMWDAVTVRVPDEQMARMQETPAQMERFLENMALGQALYKMAIDEGMGNEQLMREGAEMAAREYIAGIYVQRKAAAGVSDEAIEKLYNDRKVQYARPQVKASHILVKEESKAKEILAELENGGDFAKLAEEHSTDPGSKVKGGDLGWFEDGRMVEEFSEAAFSAEKGAIVGPVSTRFGFHIIRVDDKREMTPLEEVRDKLANELRGEALNGFIEKVKSELKVEYGPGLPGGPPKTEAAPPRPPAPGDKAPPHGGGAAPTPPPAGGTPAGEGH